MSDDHRALDAMPKTSHLRALQLAANRARDERQVVQVRAGTRLLYNVDPDGRVHRCFDDVAGLLAPPS